MPVNSTGSFAFMIRDSKSVVRLVDDLLILSAPESKTPTPERPTSKTRLAAPRRFATISFIHDATDDATITIVVTLGGSTHRSIRMPANRAVVRNKKGCRAGENVVLCWSSVMRSKETARDPGHAKNDA